MYVMFDIVGTACVDVDKEKWLKLKADNPSLSDGELFYKYKEKYIEGDDDKFSEFFTDLIESIEIDDYRPTEVRSYHPPFKA